MTERGVLTAQAIFSIRKPVRHVYLKPYALVRKCLRHRAERRGFFYRLRCRRVERFAMAGQQHVEVFEIPVLIYGEPDPYDPFVASFPCPRGIELGLFYLLPYEAQELRGMTVS